MSINNIPSLNISLTEEFFSDSLNISSNTSLSETDSSNSSSISFNSFSDDSVAQASTADDNFLDFLNTDSESEMNPLSPKHRPDTTIQKWQEFFIKNSPKTWSKIWDIHALRGLEFSNQEITKLICVENKIAEPCKELSSPEEFLAICDKESSMTALADTLTLEFHTDDRKVDLSKRNIDILPNKINDCINPESLNLSQNCLQWIPRALTTFDSLFKLNLSYNKIKEVPIEIGNLVNLKKLDMSHNELKDFPLDVLNSLQHLEKINISNNQLETVPEAIQCADDENLEGTTHIRTSTGTLVRLRDGSQKVKIFLTGNPLSSEENSSLIGRIHFIIKK